MSNRAAKYLGRTALIAQILVFGCSSSSPGTSTGTGGAGNTPGGGSGGSTGAGGAPAVIEVGSMCPSGVKNHGACTTEPPCWNTCGPLHSGVKNCNCVAGMWDCPLCQFYPEDGATHNYSCFKLDALAACPPDATGMLPQSGTACTQAPCMPCGSATPSGGYRDSTGVPKAGYCVCSDGMSPTYSCGSVNEWPPVQ